MWTKKQLETGSDVLLPVRLLQRIRILLWIRILRIRIPLRILIRCGFDQFLLWSDLIFGVVAQLLSLYVDLANLVVILVDLYFYRAVVLVELGYLDPGRN